MREVNKRGTFGLAALTGEVALLPGASAMAAASTLTCHRSFKGERTADLSDRRVLNPLIGGDRPDPAMRMNGAGYYMTCSIVDSCPRLTLRHGRDLVNWRPRTAAPSRNFGSVWTVSVGKHSDRYFLNIPVEASPNDTHVIHADHIDGPRPDPVTLGLHGHIDPTWCHD